MLEKFVEYVSLNELYRRSDLISLHCPLTDKNRHMINSEAISKMRDGVILVNTSRGGLIDTTDLIRGLKQGKFHGVGLDVYEEEAGNVYENRSCDMSFSSTTSRLLAFPNVVMTSHQGFYTKEALDAIAATTLQNATEAIAGKRSANDIA